MQLENGENRLVAESTAEFDVVEIAGVPAEVPPAAQTEVRTVDVESWGDTERAVSVGAGEESLLFLPENFNAGWEAELDGEVLTALRVDGWQQGWVVPAGDGGEVTLSYAPQRAYFVLLLAGLLVSGGVLVAGLVVLLGLLRRRAGGRQVARGGASSPSTWVAGGRVDPRRGGHCDAPRACGAGRAGSRGTRTGGGHDPGPVPADDPDGDGRVGRPCGRVRRYRRPAGAGVEAARSPTRSPPWGSAFYSASPWPRHRRTTVSG